MSLFRTLKANPIKAQLCTYLLAVLKKSQQTNYLKMPQNFNRLGIFFHCKYFTNKLNFTGCSKCH